MNHTDTQFQQKWLLRGLLILVIAVLSTGCTPLETPEPTLVTPTPMHTLTPTPTIDWFPATPTPTILPSATPTPQTNLQDPYEGLGDLIVQDDFINTAWWETIRSGSGNVAFGEENLTFAVSGQGNAITSISQHTLPQNFYLEVTLQTSLCQGEDHIGLIIWQESSDDFYRLLFNCGGQYRFELVQDGLTYGLVNWTGASQVQVGAPATNELGLWVNEGDLRFFLNGAYQFTERVAMDRQGLLGLYAKTVISPAMTVKFSNLAIYQVETN